MFCRTAPVFLFAAAALALQQCTFEPENEYVNPIAPPEPIAVTIEVNDPNFSNPYYLIESTTFRFTLKDVTKPVLSYVITIDGNIVAEGNDKNIQFFLFPHALPSGTHVAKLQIRLGTQTGSLADKLGAEYYLVEQTFQIINDPTPPPAVEPTAAYEEGKLTIRWNASAKKNFYYVIKRTYSPYFTMRDSVIKNPEQNVFVDPGYMGGELKYTITATGFGFERYELGSVTFKDDPVDFQLTRTNGDKVQLRWTESKIDVQDSYLSVDTDGRTILQPMTSSGSMVIDTLMLGEDRNYWIKTSRERYPQQTFQRIQGVTSPKQLKTFKSHAMLVDENKLLVLTSKAIYRYSLPSFSLEDSLLSNSGAAFSSLAVNDDGNRAVYVDESWGLYEFDAMDFDVPVTMANLFTPTRLITGGTDEIRGIWLGNISRSGLVTLVVSKDGRRVQLVFDINTNTITWFGPTFQYLNEMYPPVISSDGVWLANDYPVAPQGDVYKWTGVAFDLVGKVAPGSKFFRSGNHQLISGTRKDGWSSIAQGRVAVYDLNALPSDPSATMTVLQSMDFPAIQNDYYFTSTGYDRHTDLFYVRSMRDARSRLRLYNPGTMTLAKEVSAFTYTIYSHAFENNYHLSNRGYIEPVQ